MTAHKPNKNNLVEFPFWLQWALSRSYVSSQTKKCQGKKGRDRKLQICCSDEEIIFIIFKY